MENFGAIACFEFGRGSHDLGFQQKQHGKRVEKRSVALYRRLSSAANESLCAWKETGQNDEEAKIITVHAHGFAPTPTCSSFSLEIFASFSWVRAANVSKLNAKASECHAAKFQREVAANEIGT
jgi:hypothetical protein